MKPLEQEYHFYLAHHDELVEQYEGKYLIIQGTTVLGAYDNESDAIQKTLDQGLALGTFLVQHCTAEVEVQVYHSRVNFDHVFA